MELGLNETLIETRRTQVPEIYYIRSNGKQARYYADIYIPHLKKCIEVKSSWTVLKDNVMEKHDAVKAKGYISEIWVYDKKGNKIQVIE